MALHSVFVFCFSGNQLQTQAQTKKGRPFEASKAHQQQRRLGLRNLPLPGGDGRHGQQAGPAQQLGVRELRIGHQPEATRTTLRDEPKENVFCFFFFCIEEKTWETIGKKKLKRRGLKRRPYLLASRTDVLGELQRVSALRLARECWGAC